MREKTYVEVVGFIRYLTDRAMLLDVDDDEQWVSLSLVEEEHDDLVVDATEEAAVHIEEWKAEQLGWR